MTVFHNTDKFLSTDAEADQCRKSGMVARCGWALPSCARLDARAPQHIPAGRRAALDSEVLLPGHRFESRLPQTLPLAHPHSP